MVDEGRILNASFTDYLLPTFLDAPDIEIRIVEDPDHWGPYGAKGIGEPPTISSVPAVVAAIRNATGRDLNRAPGAPPRHRRRLSRGRVPPAIVRKGGEFGDRFPVADRGGDVELPLQVGVGEFGSSGPRRTGR